MKIGLTFLFIVALNLYILGCTPHHHVLQEPKTNCYITTQGRVCDSWAWDIKCAVRKTHETALLWKERKGAEVQGRYAASHCMDYGLQVIDLANHKEFDLPPIVVHPSATQT